MIPFIFQYIYSAGFFLRKNNISVLSDEEAKSYLKDFKKEILFDTKIIETKSTDENICSFFNYEFQKKNYSFNDFDLTLIQNLPENSLLNIFYKFDISKSLNHNQFNSLYNKYQYLYKIYLKMGHCDDLEREYYNMKIKKFIKGRGKNTRDFFNQVFESFLASESFFLIKNNQYVEIDKYKLGNVFVFYCLAEYLFTYREDVFTIEMAFNKIISVITTFYSKMTELETYVNDKTDAEILLAPCKFMRFLDKYDYFEHTTKIIKKNILDDVRSYYTLETYTNCQKKYPYENTDKYLRKFLINNNYLENFVRSILEQKLDFQNVLLQQKNLFNSKIEKNIKAMVQNLHLIRNGKINECVKIDSIFEHSIAVGYGNIMNFDFPNKYEDVIIDDEFLSYTQRKILKNLNGYIQYNIQYFGNYIEEFTGKDEFKKYYELISLLNDILRIFN